MLNETPRASDESLTRDPLISSPALHARIQAFSLAGWGGGGGWGWGGGAGLYDKKNSDVYFFNPQLILQKLNG